MGISFEGSVRIRRNGDVAKAVRDAVRGYEGMQIAEQYIGGRGPMAVVYVNGKVPTLSDLCELEERIYSTAGVTDVNLSLMEV